jgi:hypothetical protein
MCDDVEAVAHSLRDHGMACTPLQEEYWGILMSVTLPGGGKLGIYQSKHPRPAAANNTKSVSR